MSTPMCQVTKRGRVMYADDVAERARALHAVGFSKYRIAHVLVDEFDLPRTPTKNTITSWLNSEWRDAWAAKKRAQRYACRPGLSVVQGTARSPEWKLHRMRALRELGLSFGDIAGVMALDFPSAPLNDEQVRHAVNNNSLHALIVAGRPIAEDVA